MKWTVTIARPYLAGTMRTSRVPERLPAYPNHRRAYKIENRHADVWAHKSIAWALILWDRWQRKRWILEDLLWQLWWMEGDHLEAPTFRSLKLRWPLGVLRRREESRQRAAREARA